MAASTIFFNGRIISVPGPYSEVDASGLEVIGLTATGIVALVGEAVGGKPWNAVGDADVKDNLQVATNPQQPFGYFREGDLKEAAPLAFGPSQDEDIQAGAQEIVFVKTNPSTQSAATFDNTDGDCLTLTSRDYGYFTTQIGVQIGTGTNQGKIITINLESTSEVFDDVGGDALFTLTYLATTPANGYDTITLATTASALTAAFTMVRVGLDGDITNQVTATQAIEVVSDAAGDTTQSVTIYGTDTSDDAQSETLLLTGTTIKIGTATWNSIHGAVIDAAPAGTVTVQNTPGGTAITTLTSGALTKGLRVMSEVSMANSVLTVVAAAAAATQLTVVGKGTNGSTQLETLTLNGTTPVLSTGSWSSLTYLAFGAVAAATSVTASGNAVNQPTTGSPTPTIQTAADKFNATPGFTFAILTGVTTLALINLDYVTATSVLSPAAPSFYANLYAIISKLNNSSSLVSAERVTPGTNVPDNTTAETFLTGGNEGSTTPGQEGVPTSLTADWQGAIDLLTKVRVNTVIVLTSDPAIHAYVLAHCNYMSGVGRSERDTIVGMKNAALDGLPTKTEIKSQIVDLNSRNVRAWAQNVERYNTLGVAEVMDPMMGAVLVGGMQAGSAPGTPLTWKYINTLSLDQHSTWNPVDDAEEMIQAGLCFAEKVDGVGRRIVRNVTTHLTSSNIAYTEASVNEAVNLSVYNLRTAMEIIVGTAGFAGTAGVAKTEATNQLGLQIGVLLVNYRSVDADLILDVIELSAEISPVLPVNFVKATMHLVSVPQSAQAA